METLEYGVSGQSPQSGLLVVHDPRTDTFANYHSEPFLAEDIFYLDGLGKQRVYVMPSRKLVILRVGSNDSEWDDAWLPNHFVAALD